MFYGLLFMFIIVVLPGMLSWRSLFTLAPNVKLGDDSPPVLLLPRPREDRGGNDNHSCMQNSAAYDLDNCK